MSNNPNHNLENLHKKKEDYTNKAFRLVLELLYIFGVPAFVALIGGKRLDKHFNTENTIVISFLVVAFIFSWAITILKYRRISKTLSDLDKEIEKERDASNFSDQQQLRQ